MSFAPFDLELVLNNAREFLLEGQSAKALKEIEWALKAIKDDREEYDREEEIQFGAPDEEPE